MEYKEQYQAFDLKLAIECAEAFAASSGLGCTVSDGNGKTLYEAGQSCAGCKVCEAACVSGEQCIRVQSYGMTEAERFGGKYIYFCPMGLTCFVSPIMGQEGSAAKITAGPFLMVDDYAEFDLKERLGLDENRAAAVLALTERLPYIPAGKVNALSILLFMAVGFMNNVSSANRMLDLQGFHAMQGQITAYILELKNGEKPPEYPIATEKALLASIADSDKQEAQKLLNELLGYILFSSGGNFAEIRSRVYELIVVISRAAADTGASIDETFRLNHGFYLKAAQTQNIDELCLLLSGLVNRYIDSLFSFPAIKNADAVNKAVQFMRANCERRLSLEDAAKTVFLSPAYFSKIFRKETGHSFNSYLNRLRVEKSKRLLLQTELQLVDIAGLSGFEDQSYFTKVFKRMTGMPPNQYRKSGGKSASANKKD